VEIHPGCGYRKPAFLAWLVGVGAQCARPGGPDSRLFAKTRPCRSVFLESTVADGDLGDNAIAAVDRLIELRGVPTICGSIETDLRPVGLPVGSEKETLVGDAFGLPIGMKNGDDDLGLPIGTDDAVVEDTFVGEPIMIDFLVVGLSATMEPTRKLIGDPM